ncbi:class I adenylate-forming enzyme family protein [Oricola indica]|uniref:class I adenylate-forming enzyme family protein n=1 Tax=Oricola indica TaxID=2872591 RepID=UPI003CCBE0F5
MVDIFKAIEEHAKRNPSSLALIGHNVYLSYAAFAHATRNISALALASNIAPGSLVGVRCGNPYMELLLYCGLMRAGMTIAFPKDPSVYANHNVELDVLLSDDTSLRGQSMPAKRVVPLTSDWTQPRGTPKRPEKNPQYAALFASSGSTGNNKLFHANRANLDFRIKLKEHEVFFDGDVRYLSLFLAGTMISFIDMLITWKKGGQVVLTGTLSHEQALDAIALYQPTYLAAPPYSLVGMLNALETTPRRFQKVNSIYTGGSYCAPRMLEAANEKLCHHLIPAYGLTELGLVALSPYEELASIDGAVGKPVTGMTVEAVDEFGNTLPSGETGEIRITPPPGSPLGFYRDNRRIEIVDHEWFAPGDVGHIDANGFLVTTGRKKNVINYGGNKFDPERIENTLIQMPEIEDVAVGVVPGPGGFDVIIALVRASREIDTDAVNKYLKSKRQPYDIASVQLVASVPRGENGKVKRQEVAEQVKSAA